MPPHAAAQIWTLNVPIVSLAFAGKSRQLALAAGDGHTYFLDLAQANPDQWKSVPTHDGSTLCLCADWDEKGFLSGGDDGTLKRVTPAGAEEIARFKGKWVEQVAASPMGKIRAASVGKMAYLFSADGVQAPDPFPHTSTVSGLAFNAKGKRLAVSHYGGISLWWAGASAQKPVALAWKGSHLSVLWHPDGKYVVTTLQESALHGWRMADFAEMQMTGYSGKIRTMDWTMKAKYLATGGSNAVICWPFTGDGPWGKQPITLGDPRPSLVSAIATHPAEDMLAAGYADGAIMIAPVQNNAPGLIIESAGSSGPIVALIWVDDVLVAASEQGRVTLYTASSIKAALKP
jgi:WD40 repeat protein